MSVNFGNRKGVNEIRRENKKKIDVLKKQPSKHEMKVVFNTFYRDQVAALYREVQKGK